MSTAGCNPGELFKAYEAAVLRFIRGHGIIQRIQRETGDADSIAKDISSEVWVRVLEYEGQLENTRHTKAWLFTIAGNLVKDYQRARLRKRTERLDCALNKRDRKTLGNTGAGNAPVDEADNSVEPRDPRMQEWVQNLEDEEEVDFRLQRIDVPSREVIKYRLAGWTLGEIAEKTNTALSTVKARFYRAKAELEATPVERPVHLESAPIRCGSIETLRHKHHMFFARRR